MFCFSHLVSPGIHDIKSADNYIIYLDGCKACAPGECKLVLEHDISNCVMLEITYISVLCSLDQKPEAVSIPT